MSQPNPPRADTRHGKRRLRWDWRAIGLGIIAGFVIVILSLWIVTTT